MQTKFTINSWQDYWNLFEILVESLLKSEQYECVSELRKARTFVNGMTTGWFEFLFHFSNTVNVYKDNMSDLEISIAKFLITSLKKSLYKKDAPQK